MADQDITAIWALQLIHGAREYMAKTDARLTAAVDDTQRQVILEELGAHVASLKAAFVQLDETGWTRAELQARYTAMLAEYPATLVRYTDLQPLIVAARSDIRNLPAVRTKMTEVRTAIEPEVRVRP